MNPFRFPKLVSSFLLFFFISAILTLSAKDYRITKAEIKAIIKKNGTVSFEETRTYVFEGSYTWASFELERKGFDNVSNFSVWDGDKLYLEDDSNEPGTFSIRKRSKKYEIKYFFDVNNEEKKITSRYDLEKALVSDEEWTEFYWTFLGSRWNRKNEQVIIQLEFEDSIPFFYWVDVGTQFKDQKNLKGWTVETFPIYRRDKVRIKTHFPSSYLVNANTANGNINPETADRDYNKALNNYEARLEMKAEYAAYGKFALVVIILISILVFYRLYNRNKPNYPENLAIPENAEVHPALLNYLINYRATSGGALKASLMKLIFDGYFILDYHGREKKRFSGNRPLIKIKTTDLTADSLHSTFEKDLYTFIKERSEQYEYFDELFKKEQSKVSKWYLNWSGKILKQEAKKQDWFITESKEDIIANVIAQLLLLIMSGFVAYVTGPLAIIGIVVVAICLLGSFGMYHRNFTGEAYFRKMKETKKMIRDFRKKKIEVPQKANWTLFIWALALDNSKEDLKYLLRSWQSEAIPNIVIDATLSQTAALFFMDDFLMMTHGAYFGAGGVAGSSSGASGGAGGGGGGGGAG